MLSIETQTKVEKLRSEAREHVLKAEQHYFRQLDLIHDYNQLIGWLLEQPDVTVRAGSGDDYLTISLHGPGSRLGAVWHELRTAGLETQNRVKKGDTAYYGFWTLPDKIFDYKFFLIFSSSECVRVEVGRESKLVETPIYEVRCGEQLDPEAFPVSTGIDPRDEVPF